MSWRAGRGVDRITGFVVGVVGLRFNFGGLPARLVQWLIPGVEINIDRCVSEISGEVKLATSLLDGLKFCRSDWFGKRSGEKRVCFFECVGQRFVFFTGQLSCKFGELEMFVLGFGGDGDFESVAPRAFALLIEAGEP